jgi:hypothetical protein
MKQKDWGIKFVVVNTSGCVAVKKMIAMRSEGG